MRAHLKAAFCLALIVLGGCQTIEYGPLDGEIVPVYGYQETQTREGEYILMIRALGGSARNRARHVGSARARVVRRRISEEAVSR